MQPLDEIAKPGTREREIVELIDPDRLPRRGHDLVRLLHRKLETAEA